MPKQLLWKFALIFAVVGVQAHGLDDLAVRIEGAGQGLALHARQGDGVAALGIDDLLDTAPGSGFDQQIAFESPCRSLISTVVGAGCRRIRHKG